MFTVSDVKIKPDNKVSQMIYSETNEYYTFDSDTNEYTWESEYNIMEHRSHISSELIEDWLTAVMNYVNNYNSKLNISNIKFEVMEIRENAMYSYKKYINNALVEEGWKDYGMISESDMDAWVTGVTNFRKKFNMPLPKDKMKESLNKINTVRNMSTSPFDSDTSGSTPNLLSAIATLTTDPCNFPSKITEAVKTGTSGPIDKMKNSIIGLKKEININISKSTDDFNIAVGPTMDPVINTVETQVNNRSDEDDVADEYYRKNYAQELELINKRLEKINTSTPKNTSGTSGTNETSGEFTSDDNYENNDIILSTSNGYEIPTWMSTNISNAMKARFSNNGVPDKSTIDRYNEHKTFFFQTFQKYNVPTQLTVLSIIESNVKNISKENSATAKGMWQFIRLVGQDYGLLQLALKPGLGEDYNKYNSKNYDIVSTYDKRDEMEPSTIAAAKLLRDIRKGRKKIYNWLLVAAGYNWGGGNVSKAITKAGSDASLWDVWKRMPLETRNYVCLVIGLCNYLGYSLEPLFE